MPYVTPGELLINPFYQNRYDFVKVKTFKAGRAIPAATICFFENTHQDILIATSNTHNY